MRDDMTRPLDHDLRARLAARRRALFDPSSSGVEHWDAPDGHRDAISARLSEHLTAAGVAALVEVRPDGDAVVVHLDEVDLLAACTGTMWAPVDCRWALGVDRGSRVLTTGALLEAFNPYRSSVDA